MSSLTVFVVVLALTRAVVARPKDASVNSKREVDGCGTTTFWDPVGVISTPNFPANYPNSKGCWYTVRSNRSSIDVNFLTCECELESHSQCVYDYIKIGNGSRLCGNTPNVTSSVSSQSGYVSIKFRSDSSITRKGCQIAYGVSASTELLRNLCRNSRFNGTASTSTPESTSDGPFNPTYVTTTPETPICDTMPLESTTISTTPEPISVSSLLTQLRNIENRIKNLFGEYRSVASQIDSLLK